MPVVRIRTLGPVAAEVDGGTAPPELLWRKHLALLVYLAKSPRRTRSREHLIGLFWGDRPEASARHSLNEAVRLVRRHLGEDAVVTGGSLLTLSATSVQLDEDGPGEFMEGFVIPGCTGFEEWLAGERGAHRRMGVEQLIADADARLARGDVAEGTRLAEEAVALVPTSAPAARTLMRALALGGHGAMALEACDRLGRSLSEELGASLDPETAALRDRIRRGYGARRRQAPASEEPPAREPLVGRATEMQVIGDAVRAALEGRHAAICIVEGESGSGKTRLLDELADRARLAGFTVALARSMPSEAAETWAALGGLVRGGLMDSPGVVGAAPAAFAAVASADDQRARGGATDTGLTPGRGLPDVLRAACDESPVLLVLDDAQWCDAPTLGAVAASARDLARQPFAVLLGVRLQPASASLDEIRAHIGRDLHGVCVRLGPLDASAVDSLAETLLPGFVAGDRERLVRRVQVDSAGSPLLAVEMLRAVAHGMDIGRATRSWPEPGRTLDDTIPADLPDAVVSAIRVNYRRLTADAQAALAAAAVLGDRVSEKAVALGSGLPSERAAEALDELEWQRWLVADGRGYAFSARLVRDVVARDFLTPGQRERIARRASVPGASSA